MTLPRRNKPDLENVSDEVKREFKFVFVDSADEVLEATLSPTQQMAPDGVVANAY